MDTADRRPRGRPRTDSGQRTIRLPGDLLAAWDASTTDQIRAALRKGLMNAQDK